MFGDMQASIGQALSQQLANSMNPLNKPIVDTMETLTAERKIALSEKVITAIESVREKLKKAEAENAPPAIINAYERQLKILTDL